MSNVMWARNKMSGSLHLTSGTEIWGHEPLSQVGMEPEEPSARTQQEHVEDQPAEGLHLDALGLPEIMKEKMKLQQSLLLEKRRMYMFEKNYLQSSASVHSHGNILAGDQPTHQLAHGRHATPWKS